MMLKSEFSQVIITLWSWVLTVTVPSGRERTMSPKMRAPRTMLPGSVTVASMEV